MWVMRPMDATGTAGGVSKAGGAFECPSGGVQTRGGAFECPSEGVETWGVAFECLATSLFGAVAGAVVRFPSAWTAREQWPGSGMG